MSGIVNSKAPASTGDDLFPYTGKDVWFSCDPTSEVAPRVASKGIASATKTPPMTVSQCMKMHDKKNSSKDCLMVERPCPVWTSGKVPPALERAKWTKWSVAEMHKDCRNLAKGMLELGFKQFETVNVWGFNSPEWMMASFAGAYAGGKWAGIYPTDTGPTAAYKVVHSGGAVVMIDDDKKLQVLLDGLNDEKERGDCKHLKAIVNWDPTAQIPEGKTVEVKGLAEPVKYMTWNQLIALGDSADDSKLDERESKISPGHCCSLIYTSGTTGEPKAVMISHDNVLANTHCVFDTVAMSCGYGNSAEERILSYLPLSHIAGTLADMASMLVMGALMPANLVVFFARQYDLKAGSIKDRMVASKPTAFLGVPLVWDKMADKVKEVGAKTTGFKKTMADWAKGKASAYAESTQIGGSGAKPCCLGSALGLLGKVKEQVGLDATKYCITGAAPMRPETSQYYATLGININEVYGMSECTGITTVSTDQTHALGSCGYALPGTEVKAFKIVGEVKTECPRAPSFAEKDDKFQGELCFRGRHIMMGYLANPDMGQAHLEELNAKTAESIDKEGWLHSGDKGMISVAGMIKITGRYKEIIIGEGGENIAPVPIEDNIKALCDGINEIMMSGDKRKYNVAIFTLKAKGASGDTPGTDDLDGLALKVSTVTKISEAIKDPKWIEVLTDAIKKTNSNGKVCPNNAFKIQKFTILPTNFSEELGELTPTKKLKRAIVEKKYKHMIDLMYADNTAGKMYYEYVEA